MAQMLLMLVYSQSPLLFGQSLTILGLALVIFAAFNSVLVIEIDVVVARVGAPRAAGARPIFAYPFGPRHHLKLRLIHGGVRLQLLILR